MDFKEKIKADVYYSSKKYRKNKPKYDDTYNVARIGIKTNIKDLNSILTI